MVNYNSIDKVKKILNILLLNFFPGEVFSWWGFFLMGFFFWVELLILNFYRNSKIKSISPFKVPTQNLNRVGDFRVCIFL